ncbi:MAG: hypothetical protein JW965_00385 [Bacteroidales bacterium]|nr:hypothetical protein [Bacteroidales bacterium]
MKTNALHRFSSTVIVIMIVITAMYFSGCRPTPLQIYDFEDGTTQGWKVTAVSDDQQNFYTPFFDLYHSGKNQNLKSGYLVISGGQFGSWSQVSGFPENTSKYWELTAYYTGLEAWGSDIWQGIKGVEADVQDDFGTGPDQIKVNIGLRVDLGGQSKEIAETDTQGNPIFHPINHASSGKWSNLKANLIVPSNAIVDQVWIKFKGDLNPGLYEGGGLYIDNVKPVK